VRSINGEGGRSDEPIAGITYNDAVDFCRELSRLEKERHFLPADNEYRLPTDHEWSCAVGLHESASDSMEKKARNVEIFPWGTEFPPTHPVGNYGFIPGYNYGHTKVVSVGMYPPNDLGIYDLGGNVLEFCSPEAKQNEAVLRGGSYRTGILFAKDNAPLPHALLSSSKRIFVPKDGLPDGDEGFRCVLDP
jgi:formylglycine-generating enzyme required for sulfatase activity